MVLTFITRTLNKRCTASLMAGLLAAAVSSNVYLPASVPRMLFSVKMGRRITTPGSVIAPKPPPPPPPPAPPRPHPPPRGGPRRPPTDPAPDEDRRLAAAVPGATGTFLSPDLACAAGTLAARFRCARARATIGKLRD